MVHLCCLAAFRYALQPCDRQQAFFWRLTIITPPRNTTFDFVRASDCNMMTAAAAVHAGKIEDAHANGHAFSASSRHTTRRSQHGKGDFSSSQHPSASRSAHLSHRRQSVSGQSSAAHAACCRLSKQGATAWNGVVVPSTRAHTWPTLRAPRLLARNGMRCPFSSSSPPSPSPPPSSFTHSGARLPLTDVDHESYRNQPDSGWRHIPSPTSLQNPSCCGHWPILQHSFLTSRRSCLSR